jgi:hypothetical protein
VKKRENVSKTVFYQSDAQFRVYATEQFAAIKIDRKKEKIKFQSTFELNKNKVHYIS